MMNHPITTNNQSYCTPNNNNAYYYYRELYNNNHNDDVIRSASPPASSSSSSSTHNDCATCSNTTTTTTPFSSQWMKKKKKKQKKGSSKSDEEFSTTTATDNMKPQAQQQEEPLLTRRRKTDFDTSRRGEEVNQQHDLMNREQEQDHHEDDNDLLTFSTDPAFAEYLLSSRLNQISLEERSQALYDLHGVNDHNICCEESPEFVQQKIQQMNYVLLNLIAEMSPTETSAFRCAVSIDSNYVDSIKLMFLRSESYKPKDASQRLLRYFDLKLDLFGEQYLTKDIGLDDLQPEAYKILHSGFIRLLPCRDRAGRAIILVHGPTSAMFPNNHIDVLKVFFCFVMSILKGDDQSQIYGMVGIYWAIGQYSPIKGRFPLLVRIGKALPWKLVGRHACRESSSFFGSVMEYFIRNCAGSQLATARFHNGTIQECYYNLMTFGIPKEALPEIINGSMSLKDHHGMLQTIKHQQRQGQKQQQQRFQQQQQQQQQQREKISPLSTPIHPNVVTAATAANVTTTASSNNNRSTQQQPIIPPKQQQQQIILVPNPMDVLMGKGYQPTKRPGLLRMQNLIIGHYEQYITAKRNNKMNVCKLVLTKMKQNYGCRFIMTISTTSSTTTSEAGGQGGGGYYVECTETQALEKISHAFRNLKQKQKRELNKTKQQQQVQLQVQLQQQQKQEEEESAAHNKTNESSTATMGTKKKKKRNLDEAV